jgi:hypothetical protein
MILMKEDGSVKHKWTDGEYVEIDSVDYCEEKLDVGVFDRHGKRTGGMELRFADDKVFINPITGITFVVRGGNRTQPYIIYGRLG